MTDVTRVLNALEAGDATAADQLLPLIYDELRRMAARQVAQEKPGQLLDATELVHEAYIRLVGTGADRRWDSRRHFFAAAAEAMRRILIDAARRKQRVKHGGALQRHTLDSIEIAAPMAREPLDMLALNEALQRFAGKSPRRAELVKLRYFAGCTLPEVAAIQGISVSTAEDDWAYAKAWLMREIGHVDSSESQKLRK